MRTVWILSQADTDVGRKAQKRRTFAVEIGEEQGQAVSRIFEGAGFVPEIVRDYSGHDRIVRSIKR